MFSLQGDERRDAVEIVVADRYRGLVANEAAWSHAGMQSFLVDENRRLVEQFVASHPDPSDEKIAAAEQQLVPYQWEIYELIWTSDHPFYTMPTLMTFAGSVTVVMLVLVIIPSFLCAVLLGDSLLLRSLDIAIVTKRGAPASRWRVLWRMTVLWSLVLLIVIAAIGKVRLSAVILIGGIGQMFLAERGLHDRLAGT